MNRYTLNVNGKKYDARVLELNPERARIEVDEKVYEIELVDIGRRPDAAVLPQPQGAAAIAAAAAPATKKIPAPGGALTAPLPGLILKLGIREGDTVRAGQLLLTMEAMKMENEINAAHNGIVRKVFVAEGDSVAEGDPLVEISRPEMTTL